MEPNANAPPESFSKDFTESDIGWPGGRALFTWWDKARGKRAFPKRRDFSPSSMIPFLPAIIMFDVGGAGRPYTFRLVGTAITDVLDFDPTGMGLDEIPATANIRTRYDWVLEHKKPYMCTNLPTRWAKKDYKFYSTLVLPLGPSDDEVTMLIANANFGKI